MENWTAFVDESGLFEPAEGGWLPGMRLVAGPLLPLPRELAEARCQQALRAVLDGLGMGWWSAPVHGSEIADPTRLARVFLNMDGAPDWARRQAEQVEQTPGPLRATGQRLLGGLRQGVGRLLAQEQGWAQGVCEFGCPTTLRGEPGPLPYRRMLLAWLDHALLQIASEGAGPTRLEVLVASRSGAVPAHSSPWSKRLIDLGGVRLDVTLVVHEARAQEAAGLQTADLIAHGLGPGSQQAIPPVAGFIASRDQKNLAVQANLRFGPGLRYVERDALVDHRLVNRATMTLGQEERFERVVQEAQALPPSPLPRGHFPASLQACSAAVPALRRLWP